MLEHNFLEYFTILHLTQFIEKTFGIVRIKETSNILSFTEISTSVSAPR